MRRATVGLAVLCALALAPALPAAMPDSGSAKLTYEAASDLLAVETPLKALSGGLKINVRASKGTIDVCGEKVAWAAAVIGKDQGIGLDVNGNGTVEPNEMQKIVNRQAAFKLKVGSGKKEVAIGFDHIGMSGGPDGIVGVWGEYFSGCGYKGIINGVQVRLVDQNLDGKITQDGSDAIIIGPAKFAQPLLKQHVVGGALFELTVSADAATLDFKKIDAKLAKVDVPLLKSAVGCLVLADESSGRVYDLVSNRTGLPAGSYKLVYGIMGSGKDEVTVRPSAKMAAFEVKEDGANSIKMGPPLKATFMARYDASKAEVSVLPVFTILGACDEAYTMNLTEETKTPPQVVFTEGNKPISRESMSYG